MTNSKMLVIGGNSIEELEMNLEAMKKALAVGAPMCVGGKDMADVNIGMEMMKTFLGNMMPAVCPCHCETEIADEWDEEEDDDLWDESLEEEEEEEEVTAEEVTNIILENGLDVQEILYTLGDKLEECGRNGEILEAAAQYLGGEIACGNTTFSEVMATMEEEL